MFLAEVKCYGKKIILLHIYGEKNFLKLNMKEIHILDKHF